MTAGKVGATTTVGTGQDLIGIGQVVELRSLEVEVLDSLEVGYRPQLVVFGAISIRVATVVGVESIAIVHSSARKAAICKLLQIKKNFSCRASDLNEVVGHRHPLLAE